MTPATDLPVSEPLRTGAMRRVPGPWKPPASTIYVIYPGNRPMLMKVRAFVDHLLRCFGRLRYWDAGI
jgi:DNA-binding transcriptional LysR family regulator